ncbi:serine/arginine repetitive matrix protein 2-like [Sorex araneus]|uniref:serine/arginine repetitive matrix protein 2-like n=1 Tax=Sorex araneus TaxID=42254 RepID=UPI002433D9CA|nr:serine/arginine repetitive matrix protein 2-like [Sorex araneus]
MAARGPWPLAIREATARASGVQSSPQRTGTLASSKLCHCWLREAKQRAHTSVLPSAEMGCAPGGGLCRHRKGKKGARAGDSCFCTCTRRRVAGDSGDPQIGSWRSSSSLATWTSLSSDAPRSPRASPGGRASGVREAPRAGSAAAAGPGQGGWRPLRTLARASAAQGPAPAFLRRRPPVLRSPSTWSGAGAPSPPGCGPRPPGPGASSRRGLAAARAAGSLSDSSDSSESRASSGPARGPAPPSPSSPPPPSSSSSPSSPAPPSA